MPSIKYLLADFQLAFLNQQNETALELANQANWAGLEEPLKHHIED